MLAASQSEPGKARPISPAPVVKAQGRLSPVGVKVPRIHSSVEVLVKAALEVKRTLGFETYFGEQNTKWYMVDPRHSTWLSAWDFVTSTTLIFVAIVTPFEVGFIESEDDPLDPLFITNRVIDVIFILDCILQFFLMTEVYVQGEYRWTSNQCLIAMHYLRTWFLIDFVSIAVSGFDYVGVLYKGSSIDVENLRMLRVLRALRLIKLVKLLTGLKIIKRYEVKFAINYAALSLLKCMIGTLLLSHWFACIWGLQAEFASSKLDTWLAYTGDYCVPDVNATNGLQCLPGMRLYVAALYWSTMTITSIGYGDIAATPT